MLTSELNNIVIVGAGLAGLTLANKLVNANDTLNVTLIGPKDERNQRISFWLDTNTSTPLEPFLSNSWQSWRFRHARSGFVSQTGRQKRYVSLDAGLYKEHLRSQLDPHRCQQIAKRVTDLRIDEQGCDILLEGDCLRATTVVDTRPPQIPETTLKQQFWGSTIDLDRPHGFSAPMLMDFDVKPVTDKGVTFIYVLPLSSSRLLVEATTFSTLIQPVQAYQDCVKQWVVDNLGITLTLDNKHSEMGILPMGPVLPLAPTLANCGLAGGAARASTGYAFTGTERQTDLMARQLQSGVLPQTQSPYSARANWMDKVFLQVAKRHPERLVELFMSMAQRLSGDEFADFLSDTGGWRPCWRTIYVAPKIAFLMAAATSWRDPTWN